MKIKKYILPIGMVILSLAILGLIFSNYLTDEYAPKAKKNITTVLPNTKLLVVAPHSDDEALGCGGYIQKVINQHGTVKIVILTNGDKSKTTAQKLYKTKEIKPKKYLQLTQQRYQESTRAMGKLGVSKKDLVFLGYPDGGTASMWEKNWEPNKPYRDKLTKANKNPYDFAYRPDMAYSGNSEARNLETIIADFKPTLVLYPHPDDHHRDHWVSYAYVKNALVRTQLKKKPQELTYLVHYSGWPAPLGAKPSAWLKPPKSLESGGYDWYNLPLSTKEIEKKSAAIQTYRSQIKHSKEFLTSFDRKNELYCTAPVVNLSSDAGSTILPNPESDYLFRFLQTFGGIKNITIKKSNSKVTLNCQTKTLLNPLYGYITSITILSKQGPPEKLDIIIKNGQIKTMYYNDKSNWKGSIKVTTHKRSIITTIDTPTKEPLYLLLSARIEAKNKTLDRTAWKMVKIK